MKENFFDTNNMVSTPHDAIAKACLRDETIAKDFLDFYLPQEIKKWCDFSTFRVHNSSFVETSLRQTHADVLYSLKIHEHTGYVYCLLEAQSTVDKLMPARMLRYQAAIAYEHFKQYKRFPTIVPVLLYTGKQSPYPDSCDLRDYLENKQLSDGVVSNAYKLIDLTSIPYEDLKTHKGIEFFELALKQAQNREQAARYILERGGILVENVPTEIFKIIIEYMMQTAESKEVLQALTNVVGESYKKDIMTIAECLKQEGLEIGVQKGRQEGRLEEKLHIAKELASIGLDLAAISKITGLDSEALDIFIKGN